MLKISFLRKPAMALATLASLAIAIAYATQPAQAGDANALLMQPVEQAQKYPCKPGKLPCKPGERPCKKSKYPCKPGKGHSPWQLADSNRHSTLTGSLPNVGGVIAGTGTSTRDGGKKNGCKKENTTKECLDYIHEGYKPKPRPKP